MHSCDFVLSAGEACRPGYHIQKNGYRLFASPLDWMMSYSLETYIDVLRTQFQQYFDQWSENDNWNGHMRWIRDIPSGMVSLHAFHRDNKVKQQLQSIQEKMVKRAQRLCGLLQAARSVGWIMNRSKSTDQELILFFDRLHEMYPRLKIHILNIKHSPRSESSMYREILQRSYGSIRELQGYDIHPDGDDITVNGWAWIGNPQLWTQALLDNFALREFPNSPAYNRTHMRQLQQALRKKRFLRMLAFGKRRHSLKQEISVFRNLLHHAQDSTNELT